MELLRHSHHPVFESELLIDIRENPTSRHVPQWNRSAIEPLAQREGLEYLHRADLGVPPSVRGPFKAGRSGFRELFRWYDDHVATPERVRELAPLLRKRPIFLCSELGPTYCHRHRLALALEGADDRVSFDL
jgi:uncharacterized protein (DUF488 family)